MAKADIDGKSAAWVFGAAVRLCGYVAAMALLDFMANAHHYGLVVVLALVVAVFGVLTHIALARRGDHVPSTARLGLLIVIGELGVVILGICHFQPFSAGGFIGLSVAAFGLGQIIAEMREAKWLNRTLAIFAVVNALAVLIAVAVAGTGGWSFIALGILLLYPALTFGTEISLNSLTGASHADALKWFRRLAPPAAGVLVIIGSALLWPIGRGWFTLALVGGFLILIGAIASNTDADWLIVLVLIAIVWSQFPREASVPTFHDGAQVQEIVALGDSYISGEGATRYFAGTNTTQAADYDKCRRAPTAWPFLVAAEERLQIDSLACSGAVADNIVNEGQYIGENPKGMRAKVDGHNSHLLSQLDLFQALHRAATVKWVFVTIGGNDVAFGDVVQACILPGDCSALGQRFLDQLKQLPAKLHAVYSRLEKTFPNKVVVVPYPIPLRDSGCNIFSSTLTDREHRFLYKFTAQLDAVIRRQAAADQLLIINDMPQSLKQPRLRICDQGARHVGINYVALNPQEGAAVDPTGWVHNSMHPTAKGHAQFARVIEDWIHASTSAGPETVNETPTPVLDLQQLLGNGTPEAPTSTSTSQWKFDETRLALLHRGIGLVFLLLGIWLFWLRLLLARRLRQQPSPAPTAA